MKEVHKVQLRGWQADAFSRFQELRSGGLRSVLWEATPGSGKTTAALRVAHDQLTSGSVQRILVVVPTAHLKIQWAHAAHKLGIHLDSSFASSRSRLTSDFHGAVVTYQQIGNRKNLFREFGRAALIILDEVHHAADGLTWGNALLSAFSDAPFVLCLSGTAFRSDSNAIPFVRYDNEGNSLPDYRYSYARAVEEGVCRPTAFFTFGGEVSWSENDLTYTAAFDDALDALNTSRRLRASLDPKAGWIQPMLKEAHTMLLSLRREHTDAGGLVVCADQTHARQMSQVLNELSGEKPVVVLSDDAGASRKIKEFSSSRAPWIIACNMVSEGVDIPRLRIGVYATTIRTKMYFRQFLGRIVRRQPHLAGHQVAYLYLPADPWLRHLAEEIESETHYAVRPPKDQETEDIPRARKAREPSHEKLWNVLDSVNSGIDAVIVHGNQLSFLPGPIQAEEVHQVVQREVSLRLDSGNSRSETKQHLCSEIKRMVAIIHRRTGKPHSAIHMTLNRTQKVQSQIHCTEEQLKSRLKLLEEFSLGERRI